MVKKIYPGPSGEYIPADARLAVKPLIFQVSPMMHEAAISEAS